MSAVVIDASAGAEIIANTRRGRTLVGLIPEGSEGWVPEHFYAEVLGVIRRQLLIEKLIREEQATAAVARLRRWRLRHASVAPLVDAAWAYRHNMSAADALYVVLAEHVGADLLTDDHALADGPTFPKTVRVLRLPSPT